MEFHGVKCVLLDIEGTICPISFVKDTLFPYALRALPAVLAHKWDAPDFQPYRDAFPAEFRSSPAALQAHVEDLTLRDVKIAYLKNLQGYLWEEGYASGAYSTPLFGDVGRALREWREEGLQVAIYSSGSVFAQKLLFAHVGVGGGDSGGKGRTEDLTGVVGGWFDTTNAGLKSEASSYTSIAEALKWRPSEVLFLSDNVKEVDAAIQAGMKSIVIDRPGNAPVSAEDRQRLKVLDSFGNISIHRPS